MDFHDLVFYSGHHYRFEAVGLLNVPFGYRTVFPEMKVLPLLSMIRKKAMC